MDLDAALGDLAAAGIVAADARWVRFALERRRPARHVPPALRRRAPHRARRARYSLAEVEAALAQRAEGGAVRIVRAAPAPPPEPREDVLGAAALARALLVPDRMLAHLLLEHDLHLETGAPVLPWSEPLPAWFVAGVGRAERPRVLVLHDSDGPPRDLAVPALPIGLRAAHVARLRLPVEDGRAEAAAIAPDRLLRALRRLLLGAPAAPRLRWAPVREAGFV